MPLSVGWFAMMCVICVIVNGAQTHPILWTASWNHDGSLFVVGGEQTLQIYESDTFHKKSLLPKHQRSLSVLSEDEYFSATFASWHPKNNHLAVSSQGRGANLNGVFNVDTEKRTPLEVSMGRGIVWDPTGNKIATANTDDGHLRIWKSDGRLLHNIPRSPLAKGLTGVSWSPSGNKIVTIGGIITLHQSDGSPIRQIQHRPEAKERLCLLLSVSWHPSGSFFVTGDYGNEIDDPVLQYWTPEGKLIKSIPLLDGAEIRNLSWSKDGKKLAIASDKLRIFNPKGNLLHQADVPDLLWGIDWHPNGQQIITSSMDGRITLWDSNAQKIKEIEQVYLK